MPKPLAEQHPELVHYTSAAGLAGILQSQTLWATHYAFLNDATEVKYWLKSRFPEHLRAIVKRHLKELGTQHQAYIDLFTKYGSESEIIDQLPNTILDFTLDRLLLGSKGGYEPMAEPYIISFCTVENVNERVYKNGLLSQWRGYGQEGGYAIVFDTLGLSELLDKVAIQWSGGCELFGGDIVYASEKDGRYLEEFGDHLSKIEEFYLDHLNRIPEPRNQSKIFAALMWCACRYKHWGFEEENEVRFVIIPNSNEVNKIAREDGITVNEIPRKHYDRSGKNIPFIELFEGITSPPTITLPIKRIIVGPSGNPDEKTKRVRSVEILLNQHRIEAEVSASEIPYIC